MGFKLQNNVAAFVTSTLALRCGERKNVRSPDECQYSTDKNETQSIIDKISIVALNLGNFRQIIGDPWLQIEQRGKISRISYTTTLFDTTNC